MENIHCGTEAVSVKPWHQECTIRSIIGSVGHQEKRCSCFGGTEEDPEGMTKREAAKAAYDLFTQRRRNYTHRDQQGVLWRFEGSRPISEMVDRMLD